MPAAKQGSGSTPHRLHYPTGQVMSMHVRVGVCVCVCAYSLQVSRRMSVAQGLRESGVDP